MAGSAPRRVGEKGIAEGFERNADLEAMVGFEVWTIKRSESGTAVSTVAEQRLVEFRVGGVTNWDSVTVQLRGSGWVGKIVGSISPGETGVVIVSGEDTGPSA